MNLTQLRAFVAVVDAQSFSGAAKALGLSQPAVTMQVQSLEADAGATLLDRRYRNVELTEAGHALLPHARGVLEQLETARHELEHLSGRVTGRLEIAASTTPGDYVIPALLGRFLAEYPEVGVAVRVLDSAAVVEAVATGAAQFGMTGARVETQGRVVYEPLGEDRLVLIGHPDSPLAARPAVPMADLADEAFIMRRPGSGTRIVTEQVFAEGGLEPGDLRVLTEFGTSEAIVRAVEGGLGIGVVSTWAAGKALRLGTVAEIQADGFPIPRPFFTVLPRERATRAAECFRDHLKESMA